jgi:predicted secreted Zn-dependent protease
LSVPLVHRCILSALLVLLPGLSAHAEPTVSESVEYYDVSGATAREVRAALNRDGPIAGNDGKRYDAVCRWNVSWEFLYQRGETSCAITSVSMQVKITFAFPRLKTDETTSPSLVKAFATFSDKLMLHEKGHGQNAIEAARKIENALMALPPESNCDVLRTKANDLARSFIKEANQADIEYDRVTQHGATQGVRFPQ